MEKTLICTWPCILARHSSKTCGLKSSVKIFKECSPLLFWPNSAKFLQIPLSQWEFRVRSKLIHKWTLECPSTRIIVNQMCTTTTWVLEIQLRNSLLPETRLGMRRKDSQNSSSNVSSHNSRSNISSHNSSSNSSSNSNSRSLLDHKLSKLHFLKNQDLLL